METTQLLAPLIFILGCLMAGAVLKNLLQRISIPYTVGLFILGIVIGVIDREGLLGNSAGMIVSLAGNINPDLILYLFLPILIFSAAYELDVHIFRRTLLNATLLSVPGVIMAMFMTAAVVMGVGALLPSYSAWTWPTALMFGALISATDPVAVVALLKELGTSKRFSTLIDAESMLNDGTGIVLFMLFFAPFSSSAAQASHSPVVSFIIVVAGGVALGFAIARIYLWFVKRICGDALIQNSTMILAAYLTFLLAQDTLQISGVIALVAFGLTIAHYGGVVLEPKVSRFMSEFWDLLSYIANTLIFIIVGAIIAIKVHFTWIDLAALFAVYIAINVIRSIVVLVLYPFMTRSGYGLSKRESIILSWGGLRGALGLTLALMVSYTESIPEPIRRQTLFFTAGIVTLTLLFNATTIKWMLSKLRLTSVPTAKILLDTSVKQHLHEDTAKYYTALQRREGLESADWAKVSLYLPPEVPSPDIDVHINAVIANLRLRILNKERSTYWALYNEGVISEGSLRKLTAAIDLMFDKDGHQALNERVDYMQFYYKPSILRLLHTIKWAKRSIERYTQMKLIRGYDVARGLIIAQKASLKLVDEFATTELIDDEKLNLKQLRDEIIANIKQAEAYMADIAENYPISYRRAVTTKATRMVKRFEESAINGYVNGGMLTEEDAELLKSELSSQNERL